MKDVVAQDGVNDVADGDGQRRVCDIPCPNAPAAPTPVTSLSPRGRVRVGAFFPHQPASAAMTSADCTTSACRGKMRPVRNS